MTRQKDDALPPTVRIEPGEELLFLPLGGANEIGMNLNLYGCRGTWVVVDFGLGFADDRLPGVDVVLPDIAFLEARRDAIAAIVLTHAHEDHLGAVPYLWRRLRLPIYATPFAAAVVRAKLKESGVSEREIDITEIPLGGRLQLGPFDMEFVSLTHSIPEPNAIAIRTPFGTVMHTGDWKIDPEPLVGDVTDEDRLREIGEEGVLAMVCDSTNVFREADAGSEADVRAKLGDLVKGRKGQVFVATFASNIARVETVVKAAADAGRKVVVLGRGLDRMIRAATETGYLDIADLLASDREAGRLPAERLLYLVTGCQGEPNAALARIARGEHPAADLREGDTVLLSSRQIPGNERKIGRLLNELARQGAEVITEKDADIHVSGHGGRDELARMYRWVKPRIAVPVHGEPRHLIEHVALARSLQVPEAVTVENGALIRLAPGTPGRVARIASGYLVADGTEILPADGEVIRARKRMLYEGAAFATVVVDQYGELKVDPRVALPGLVDPDDAEDSLAADLVEDLAEAIDGLDDDEVLKDERIHEVARLALRRRLRTRRGKKPLIDVHVVRI